MKPVWVIGNGGHAKVIIDSLRLDARYEIKGIWSDEPDAPSVGQGLQHVGPVNQWIAEQMGILSAIIAIGDNSVRARISSQLSGVVEWVSAIHHTAIVAPSATIGRGVLLSAGSIVQPCVTIGDHAIINTGAIVDHDSVIGDFAHIAPGVRLAGNVEVGPGALIGVGSSTKPGVTIGLNAIVGAGSVVIHNVPSGAKVAGNPARPLYVKRSTTQEG